MVERISGGDRAAFAQMVKAHQARVARLAYRLLSWNDDVDDVVQEVFLSAWKDLRRFRGRSSPGTWLTRIAINKCRSHWRRRFLRLKLFQAARDRPGPGTSDQPEQARTDRETFDQVRRAVQDLPTKYREVVVLRYLEEMSIDQTCEALGVSRNVLDVRLHRARSRLRVALAGLVEE